MPTTTLTNGFAQLIALGLITDEVHAAVKSHAKPILLKPDARPADYLVWLVENRLVSHGALLQLALGGAPRGDDGSADQQTEVLASAFEQLEEKATDLNARLLDELKAFGLITNAECDATLAQSFPYVLNSPSHALAYAVESGAMTRQRFADLQNQVMAESTGGDDIVRARMVGEAGLIVQALDQAQQDGEAARGRSWSSIASEGVCWILVAIQVWLVIQ